MRCGNCGRELSGEEQACSFCGTPVYQPPEPVLESEHPMKWYQILVWLGLFASAAANLWSGFSYLSGRHYGMAASAVYTAYPALRAVDISAGFACFAFAILALVTRNLLDKRKRISLLLLRILFVLAAAFNLVYCTVLTVVLKDAELAINGLFAVAVYLAVAIWNERYFKERTHFFEDN